MKKRNLLIKNLNHFLITKFNTIVYNLLSNSYNISISGGGKKFFYKLYRKVMARIVILLSIICYYSITASAQNLSQVMASQPSPTTNLNTPLPETPEIDIDSTLVSIEVLGFRNGSFFKNPTFSKIPKTFLEKAGDLYKEGLFQRRRFEETGQAIEMESHRLYYRRDNYSYTKGIILYKFMNGRMDFGIYRKNFAPASTLLTGKLTPDFNQGDSNAVLFRNGSKVFFSLRVNLSSNK